ncbi:hypothetical protein AKJ13_27265 [Methylobacterium sp. ARG-1]|nr:hypothetical protein AKJ13_27265 [Methylobacterium sp. ARG-1]
MCSRSIFPVRRAAGAAAHREEVVAPRVEAEDLADRVACIQLGLAADGHRDVQALRRRGGCKGQAGEERQASEQNHGRAIP